MKTCAMMMAILLLMLGGEDVRAADARPAAAAVKSGSKAKQPVKDATTPPAASRGNDQLTLDATVVTGNRELPKVMYIVPWKKAELSNLPGQPFNTLVDETLAPVDREVFRREVDYYEVIADKDRDAANRASNRQATPVADRK
ncbi:MAG: hypothetical protein AB7T07_00975 [Steroidobacteraceae bacterium]